MSFYDTGLGISWHSASRRIAIRSSFGNSIRLIFEKSSMQLLTPEPSLLIWMFFTVGILLLWRFALVDILRSEFEGQNEKLIWVLVVIFLPLFGPVLYYSIGRHHKIQDSEED